MSLQDKLVVVQEDLKKLNEEYRKVTSYAEGVKEEILMKNGQMQLLNELLQEDDTQ
ncbi:hypothetical protein JCM9140_3145 [Halalkalibacter wakoensis JCM 9140]|uniref:Uncharacterized protein n=1 Tax=Halalkalibacter wakoensis JCM 9140 TaxID=1236970 RepID=W4Q5R0_9BACI|nr:hypothetical protein [Halalkalibacter wakoensis]GAE27033.1 hypothetical protein JCM9140_3145 [Halalkalibacter wakoensis JCM 9140]